MEDNSIEKPKIPMTSIGMPVKLHDELANMKIISRESLYSVVQRLVDEHNSKLSELTEMPAGISKTTTKKKK